MSLPVLHNRPPKEILKILSLVSSSLLPNPNVDKLNKPAETDTKIIDSVVNEIKHRLNLPAGELSRDSQTKIFDFLSKEISNIALSDTNISKVKERLGDKGELSLEQYKIEFFYQFEGFEILGQKKSNVIDVVRNPDKYTHLKSGYFKGTKMGFTLSTKLITPKKEQDKFFQIVFSIRDGMTLHISGAIRAYVSDLDLRQVNTPLDIIKAFVNVYGLTFQLGNLREKFAQNEIIEIEMDEDDFMLTRHMKILDGQKGDFYLPVGFYFDSDLIGTNGKKLHKIVLAFAINLNKYIETLRKHNVIINPNKDWMFPRIGDF